MTGDEWFRELACNNELLGKFGEEFWATLFRDANLNYIPLYKIEDDGAPRTHGDMEEILPDYHSPQFSFWADSKCKYGSVIYRAAQNQKRIGIDTPNYEHYEAVAGKSWQHCFLVVFECFAWCLKDEEHFGKAPWSGTLLSQSLAKLGTPVSRGKPGTKTEAMSFWPRDRFEIIGQATQREAFLMGQFPKRGNEPRPHYRQAFLNFLKRETAPAVQGHLF